MDVNEVRHLLKTVPFDHQDKELEYATSLRRAIFWEMGTGKSKLAIDSAAINYLKFNINAMLVVAPNNVHRNWHDNELPAHMPGFTDYRSMAWESKKAGTKAHAAEFERVLAHPDMAVLCISYDAFITKKGFDAAMRFLRARKAFFVLDESTRIKTPKARRTKKLLSAAHLADYRRVMTGTPVTNGPFDIYSQMLFLDPGFWERHGIGSFPAFKAMFAIIKQCENPNWEPAFDKRGNIVNGYARMFDVVVAYRNLDKLQAWLAEASTRVTKSDVLDLPEKLYQEYPFELSDEQRRVYKQLKDELIVWLDSGDVVTAPLAIVKLLRLQQITCGYLPSDDEPMGRGPFGSQPSDFKKNPRLESLLDTIDGQTAQGIIWARYKRDIDVVMHALTKVADYTAVRYDGDVTSDDVRAESLNQIRRGDVQFLVANPQCAGEGLTLTECTTMDWYSRSYKLMEALQAEDRIHRIGQDRVCTYRDHVAVGTVDREIVRALRRKFDVATKITGDQIRKWI